MQSDIVQQYSHKYWMYEALGFAKNHYKSEVPVCAIVVKENKLISCGLNLTEDLNDPTAHAEIIAIREASKTLSNWRLSNCILYCTLEPCSMCMGAILNSRVPKFVFGAYDQIAGTCGSRLNLTYELGKEKQIEIIGGVCEPDCAELLKNFFAVRRKNP